jgi:hypothetical protein
MEIYKSNKDHNFATKYFWLPALQKWLYILIINKSSKFEVKSFDSKRDKWTFTKNLTLNYDFLIRAIIH